MHIKWSPLTLSLLLILLFCSSDTYGAFAPVSYTSSKPQFQEPIHLVPDRKPAASQPTVLGSEGSQVSAKSPSAEKKRPKSHSRPPKASNRRKSHPSLRIPSHRVYPDAVGDRKPAGSRAFVGGGRGSKHSGKSAAKTTREKRQADDSLPPQARKQRPKGGTKKNKAKSRRQKARPSHIAHRKAQSPDTVGTRIPLAKRPRVRDRGDPQVYNKRSANAQRNSRTDNSKRSHPHKRQPMKGVRGHNTASNAGRHNPRNAVPRSKRVWVPPLRDAVPDRKPRYKRKGLAGVANRPDSYLNDSRTKGAGKRTENANLHRLRTVTPKNKNKDKRWQQHPRSSKSPWNRKR